LLLSAGLLLSPYYPSTLPLIAYFLSHSRHTCLDNLVSLAPRAQAVFSPSYLRSSVSRDANNNPTVARIMKLALPENAKIAKEAKECMQECVSEFISFITSEGECSIRK
jgi:hypothetical protein